MKTSRLLPRTLLVVTVILSLACLAAADSVQMDNITYENVRIAESSSLYYFTIPSLGKTVSVLKEKVKSGEVVITRMNAKQNEVKAKGVTDRATLDNYRRGLPFPNESGAQYRHRVFTDHPGWKSGMTKEEIFEMTRREIETFTPEQRDNSPEERVKREEAIKQFQEENWASYLSVFQEIRDIQQRAEELKERERQRNYKATERYNAQKDKEYAEENKLRAERIDQSWTVIERISGSNNYRSENYTVNYKEFAIVWRTESGTIGDTNFMVSIEQDNGGGALVANTIGSGASKYFHKGPIEFRLDIQTGQPYVITIQGRDSK